MKKHLFALLGLLLVSAAAFGQSLKVKADIPFEFTANQVTLPAGEYVFSNAGAWTGSVVQIQGDGTTQYAMALCAREALRVEQTKLVFHRYGDRYFLAQVWSAYSGSGMEIPVTPLEKELALTDKSETVIVASNR